MTQEAFDEKYVQALDYLIQHLAENPDIDVDNFFGMTCMLENLRFFSPVIFSAIQPPTD